MLATTLWPLVKPLPPPFIIFWYWMILGQGRRRSPAPSKQGNSLKCLTLVLATKSGFLAELLPVEKRFGGVVVTGEV